MDLARRAEGRTNPNPAVGAVVVRQGRLVGEGFHPGAGEPHAEIFALEQAAAQARGADLYVTLEPCSHQGRTGPCADAVIAAGLARVQVGTLDPNPLVAGRGVEKLRAAGIEVHIGLLEDECRRLIAPFARHILTGLPHVTLKAAVTLDGKTATSKGDSKWISGQQSRLEVHRLRDRVDAIMVGIGTVLADDPQLTTRLPEGHGHDPLRILVDTYLRTPPESRILHLDSKAETLIICGADVPELRAERLRSKRVRVLRLGSPGAQVDLGQLMSVLGAEGIQSILLEGGATLNNAMLSAGFVDRLMVFMAPILMGGRDGSGIFSGAGVSRIADCMQLRDVRVRSIENDILVEGEIERCLPVS